MCPSGRPRWDIRMTEAAPRCKQVRKRRRRSKGDSMGRTLLDGVLDGGKGSDDSLVKPKPKQNE